MANKNLSTSEFRQKAASEAKAMFNYVFVFLIETLALFFAVKTLIVPNLSFSPETLLASSILVWFVNKCNATNKPTKSNQG